jgi:hypothetical protein
MMNEVETSTVQPPAIRRGAPVERRSLHHVALLAGFIVAAVALHVALVAALANPMPYSDEWIALIDNVLRPWTNGQLSLLDLFKPHNEHTIVPTRLLGLAAIALNQGQFDNVPVALFNCLLYAAAFALPICLFFRHAATPLRYFAVVLGLIALVPLEGEDLIFGFQNQYYFLIAGSTAVLWLAASTATNSRRGLVAFAAVAFATCVSMGSGFFAALLAIAICALRWRTEPSLRRDLKLRMLIALAVTACGIVLAVHSFVVMKEAGILGSKQIGLDSIRRIFSCLAWPYSQSAWIGMLVSLPFGGFALWLLRRREAPPPIDHLALGLGLWVGAQICALALDRNSEAGTLASRYMPVMLFWPAMNVYALMRLVTQVPSARGGRIAAWTIALVPALASGALVANVAKLAPASLEAMALASQQHRVQAANIARYVRLGDRNALYGAGHMGLPYPNTAKLQSLLDDPAVRNGLPVNVRPGLRVAAETQAAQGFIPFGAYERVPRNDDLPGFGSFGESGDRTLGRFRSEPIETKFPFVRIDLAGYLPDEGLTLKLECTAVANCTDSNVRPAEFARESWRGVYVRVPQPRFRIGAEDHTPTRWLAFSAPVEAGSLSVDADVFINRLRSEPYIWISLTCGILAMLLLAGIWREAPASGEA